MKNTNAIKNNIVFILIILAILALGVMIIPAKTNAQAQYGGYITTYNSNLFPEYSPTYTPTYTNTYSTNSAVRSNTVTNQNTSTANQTNNSANTSNTSAVSRTNTSSSNNSLTANAVFGSNSFIPSRLIQWVFVAILIVFIVILVRRIYGGSEKYHSTPLKHS